MMMATAGVKLITLAMVASMKFLTETVTAVSSCHHGWDDVDELHSTATHPFRDVLEASKNAVERDLDLMVEDIEFYSGLSRNSKWWCSCEYLCGTWTVPILLENISSG
ncbi:hypothetical protein [Aeromonas hydrophila]|uniref:hypothetical protein n=1 Tax=Aeromonas hydrophila TaxID=644 RepID=UPI0008084354|nr:hypothetical protein [Aeromonas hydrophila]OCA63964.1 hypothetical protein A9R12_15885 [Aeromonas hydrophila]OCY06054.1 hypothetical protein A9X69_13230 [Aeromonas hydrophila]HAU4875228.1 hypothetical protein [Aeromonas hydrophila]HAU4920262.1 hypothetical protein [Aeromonas hydrophila]